MCKTLQSSTKILRVFIVVQMVSMTFLFSCVSTTFAEDKNTGETQTKNWAPVASQCFLNPSEEQLKKVNSIIAPYKIGDNLEKTWQFACVEQTDEKNIVFSIVNNKTRKKIFVWLTSSNVSIKTGRRTNTFLITILQEDSSNVDATSQHIGEIVSDIIEKNDTENLGWHLEDYDKNQTSFKVDLPLVPNKTMKSHRAQPLWRILFLMIIPAILIGDILYRVRISKLRSRKIRNNKS